MSAAQQDARREALLAVARRFDIDHRGKTTVAGEDFAGMLDRTIERYVAVTLAEEHPYHSAYGAPTREEAESIAVAYVGDSIYPENPVAIVDLDGGLVWEVDRRPRWQDATVLQIEEAPRVG